METEALGAASELDFSLMALFLRATVTVKIVMVLLILASVWSWAIIIHKHFAYRRAKRDAESFEDAFWSGQALDQVYEEISDDPRGGSEKVFVAGMKEWRRSLSSDARMIAGAEARIDRAMNVAIARESDDTSRGLGVLATVGSISPFKGEIE
ncbi:MAG: Tol-Pal system subunit TolQ, partial [Pseudomonadota bacterium]